MSIYLMQARKRGLVKIGRAKNVRSRLMGLCKKPILLRLIEAENWVEQWLHGKFQHRHAWGEWFSFDPAMLSIEIPKTMPPMDEIYGWRWGNSKKLAAKKAVRGKKNGK